MKATRRQTILSAFAGLFVMASAALPTHAQMDRFIEGTHYVSVAADSRIDPNPEFDGEVVEFYSYGCPHCHIFAPQVAEWKKTLPANLNFIESPVSFGHEKWANLAIANHIANKLDVTEKMHPLLFKAVHEENKPATSLDDIKAIFVANGISAEDFDKAANSMQVKAAFKKSEQNALKYQVSAVPAMMVNGRWMVLSGNLTSYDEMFEIVDFLLAKESFKPSAAPAGVAESVTVTEATTETTATATTSN